jgi:hypothetical protein
MIEDEDLIDFKEARPAGLNSLNLPAFWVDKPVSWFMLAESRFRLHGIHREQTRYDYLVSPLTKEAVSLVLDVVEHPPERLPYTALKQSLLDSHDDRLSEDCHPAQDGAFGRPEAFGAAGLYAGAMSLRP